MSEKIVRYYVPENNPGGGHFPGVGLRDLTEDDWDNIPEAIQKDVDASNFYRKTAPAKAESKSEGGKAPAAPEKDADVKEGGK